VKLNYVEIYNDHITDLFSGNSIQLYRLGQGAAAEHYHGTNSVQHGVSSLPEDYVLKGASDLIVGNAKEAIEALLEGETNKHIAATKMNDRSSRAHTVQVLTCVHIQKYISYSFSLFLFKSIFV
jgi:kinesin family member 11